MTARYIFIIVVMFIRSFFVAALAVALTPGIVRHNCVQKLFTQCAELRNRLLKKNEKVLKSQDWWIAQKLEDCLFSSRIPSSLRMFIEHVYCASIISKGNRSSRLRSRSSASAVCVRAVCRSGHATLKNPWAISLTHLSYANLSL